MPHIHWIEEAEATGAIAKVYKEWMEKTSRSKLPGILKCFSHRPDFLQDVIAFSDRVHFSDGHLERKTKELIATYVSALNHCPY